MSGAPHRMDPNKRAAYRYPSGHDDICDDTNMMCSQKTWRKVGINRFRLEQESGDEDEEQVEEHTFAVASRTPAAGDDETAVHNRHHWKPGDVPSVLLVVVAAGIDSGSVDVAREQEKGWFVDAWVRDDAVRCQGPWYE